MKDRNENRGLIHIYCGDGKGKTTAPWEQPSGLRAGDTGC